MGPREAVLRPRSAVKLRVHPVSVSLRDDQEPARGPSLSSPHAFVDIDASPDFRHPRAPWTPTNARRRSGTAWPGCCAARTSPSRSSRRRSDRRSTKFCSRGVFKLERTKTGRRREVPMNLAAYTAVSELPRTGPRLFPRSVRTAWEGALERARIEDFRFHDLAAHLRVLAHSEGPLAQGGLRAARPQLDHHDHAVCPPGPRSLEVGGRDPRGFQHNVNTTARRRR